MLQNDPELHATATDDGLASDAHYREVAELLVSLVDAEPLVPRMVLPAILRCLDPRFPRSLPPVADDGSTKGVGTTLAVVKRRAKSGSAPYQADLAMSNPTHRAIQVLRPQPGFRGTYPSSRASRMLPRRAPSWR